MRQFTKLGTAFAMAMVVAAGCQETTTSGPATKVNRSGEPAVKKLTVMAKKNQTISQGGSDKISVAINRDNFNDPVTIRLNDLPQGVESLQSEVVIPAGSSSAMLEIKAMPDAAIGEHEVRLAASAPGLDENVQMFTLTVKEKG
jgi:hypothetical protein